MKQYLNKELAAEEFQIKTGQVGKIWNEIRDNVGPGKRYGNYAFVGERSTCRIRYAVMVDYMRWRTWLKDPNSVKHVPPFDVREAEIDLGISSNEIVKIDAQEVASLVFEKLAAAIGGAT